MIPEEVEFDIAMRVYDRYNSRIANMYDWVGEIYTYRDIKEMEKAEKEYEEQLKKDYLEGRLVYTDEDIKQIRMYLKNLKGEWDMSEVFTRWEDPTIEEQNKKLERIKEIIYNEKISNIEARLMIKDVLEGK